MPSFDYDDPRYKCGSGCCKAVTASVVIGILELIGATTLLVKLAWNSEDIKQLGLLVLCIYVVVNFLTVSGAVVMLVGIFRKKSKLILPHLLVQVIRMVCLVIIIVVVGLSCLILLNSKTADDVFVESGGKNLIKDNRDDVDDDKLADSETNVRRVAIVNFNNFNNRHHLQTVMTSVLAACGGIFLFDIWIFVIVLACYRYLRDRTLFGNCPSSVPLE